MAGPKPTQLKLKRKLRVILEKLARRRQTPHGLVQRAKLILLASQGLSNSEIARQLSLHRNTVFGKRDRWMVANEQLLAAQGSWSQRTSIDKSDYQPTL